MEGFPDQASEISMSSGDRGSRWNPTPEQIEILEGLYKEGTRTPSSQEIQQITGRLREFGHVEGKNVFYWFQNHKARQRMKEKEKQKQKQKQTMYSYSNRFILPKPPPASSSRSSHCPAGVCMPKLLLPRPLKRRPPPLISVPMAGVPPENFPGGRGSYYTVNNNLQGSGAGGGFFFSPGRGIELAKNKETETLELFPTQPSGDLLSPNSSSSNFPAGYQRQIQRIPAAGGGNGDRVFYDFMSAYNGPSNM